MSELMEGILEATNIYVKYINILILLITGLNREYTSKLLITLDFIVKAILLIHKSMAKMNTLRTVLVKEKPASGPLQ